MGKRVLFKSKDARNRFFNRVFETKQLNLWKELYDKLNLNRKTLEGYRTGRTTIPYSLYKILSEDFNDQDLKLFNKLIEIKNENWGRIKGGLKTYSKYKHIFDKGRLKGLKQLNKLNSKPGFDSNIPLNKELSYFIGLFIGDGFCNKYGSHYQIQFTGHKDELHYYQTFVSDISEKLFGWRPIIKTSSNLNFIRINFNSKDLYFMLTERFKIKPGRKSHNVLIPKEIVSSSSDNLRSCIAGLLRCRGICFY